MQTWTNESLDNERRIGDPPADALVASLFAGGDDSVRRANLLLRGLVDNDEIPDSALAPSLRAYLAETTLPAWAERARMDAAGRLFTRFAPHVITLLHVYSLPLTYSMQRGVQVLARTTRLQSNATRRITETAQMIVDVMSPGGLTLDAKSLGAGIRSAQKVRLMHATIRYLIQHHDPSWKAEWGTPVNQEDMAGTLLAFSVAVLDGLQRMGIELSQEDRIAYLHTWNVVGHFMGVREELMAWDPESALGLAEQIASRQQGACPEGQTLTRALIQMLEHFAPGNILDGVADRLIHFFVGDERAHILGLGAVPPLQEHLGLLRLLVGMDSHVTEHIPFVRAASEVFGRALFQALLFAFRGPNRQPFDLPTELRQVWGLNWRPVNG